MKLFEFIFCIFFNHINKRLKKFGSVRHDDPIIRILFMFSIFWVGAGELIFCIFNSIVLHRHFREVNNDIKAMIALISLLPAWATNQICLKKSETSQMCESSDKWSRTKIPKVLIAFVIVFLPGIIFFIWVINEA